MSHDAILVSRLAVACVVLHLLILSSLGCSRPENGPPSLILITLDTLRADRLGSYGYAGATTPFFDAVAARGVRFEDAIAQATTTSPSHASILTGLNPPRHGLRRLHGQQLAESNLTLAEILRDAGYSTAAFVSAPPLRKEVGLNQGFDWYQDAGSGARGAFRTNELVVDWLEQDPDQPIFLWVHYFDPHHPYFPPAEFRKPHGLEKLLPEQVPRSVNRNSPRPDGSRPRRPKAQKRMSMLYDAEIAYLDAALGKLLAALEGEGLLDRAIVALVADHGEHLGEAGYYFGHWDVLEETARVPMVIAHPDGRHAGTVVESLVGTIDLLPTLLAWLDLEMDLSLDGRDLTPLLEGTPEQPRLYYTEQFEFFPVRAVRSESWMLRQATPPEIDVSKGERIVSPRNVRPGTGPTSSSEIARRLGAELDRVAEPTERHEQEHLEVPDSVREQLRALGYTDEARDPGR
jgi:arylsulfatase A-like enzyme